MESWKGPGLTTPNPRVTAFHDISVGSVGLNLNLVLPRVATIDVGTEKHPAL